MEHIRQFDWCYSQPDIYFVKEEDLAHSVTEKILRNKFHDPLISSDSEEERPNIDWDQVFSKTQTLDKLHRIFVPCLMSVPQFPKKSAMTEQQHYQCIKVMCAQKMHVLEQEFIPRPTKNDFRVFEELKSIYEKEQKEYKAWAKTVWTTTHCIRALRPKPLVEAVYEALFKLKAHEMQSYPKNFNLAAQIPLETRNNTFAMVPEEDLIDVDLTLVPKIDKIDLTKKLNIMKSCPLPEPCNKHPCRFILPSSRRVSMLPVCAVLSELAQQGVCAGARAVACEAALACLLQRARPWRLALTVHRALHPEGDDENVLVLGDEIITDKESPITRTYRAFKYLLEQELIPPSEKLKQNIKAEEVKTNNISMELDEQSDDEDNGLYIDDTEINDTNAYTQRKDDDESCSSNEKQDYVIDDSIVGLDKCTCKDTIFERPPPRSFRKWRVTNNTTQDSFSVLVHCAHTLRDEQGELLLEPTPEYQLELGASEMDEDRLRTLALAMHLRKDAAILHVRVNGGTGEVACVERVPADRLTHARALDDVISHVHSALAQLQGLLPGNYVLVHEPSHGANALLYAASAHGSVRLECKLADAGAGAGADEALQLKTPPTISTELLPYHKFRRMLPCAFTPHERQVARPQQRALARHRTPPRALQVRPALSLTAKANDLYMSRCVPNLNLCATEYGLTYTHYDVLRS